MTSQIDALKIKIALQEEAIKTKKFELRDMQYTLRELEDEIKREYEKAGGRA